MTSRFTIDGSSELERHLARICDQVREGVCALIPEHKLEGLVLAGGYGRGEGGVLRSDSADAPYNDLEFFVFIKGPTWLNDRRYRHALHELGARLTPEAGIDVEFKVLSLSKLRSSSPTMFYYDLIMGHRWLVGDDTLFIGCDHHRDTKLIPMHEATRLMFNRCSGLFFAKARLQREDFTAEDADFVGRNIAKAQLALGDMFLASLGQYHWSCEERRHRLQTIPGVSAELIAHHEKGVAFKLHPHRSTQAREQLSKLHTEISALAETLFLRLESHRLATRFESAQAYAVSPLNKCPEHSWWKNIALNIRHRTQSSFIRYPREHLLHQLALLLWSGAPVTPGAVSAYEQLWARFN
jgi:hypothetical protein